MKPKNILITGPPRSGKSTLIERLREKIQRPAIGFFSREIKEKGNRVGFSIITLDGKQGVLAHERIKTSPRIGKYGVNLEDLDRIAVPSITPSSPAQIVMIDEIGKMECLSRLFRETLVTTLDSVNPVLGSIALHGGPFFQKIRERKDVLVIPLTQKNRDSLVDILSSQLSSME